LGIERGEGKCVRGFGEEGFGDLDEEVVAAWHGGPQALVEHPIFFLKDVGAGKLEYRV
jgi:hypothetical protein